MSLLRADEAILLNIIRLKPKNNLKIVDKEDALRNCVGNFKSEFQFFLKNCPKEKSKIAPK